MSQPFVGEIRMFAGNFAPSGWMFCDGALLPISENETLFYLIGTTYGGDGESTFALPDLRSRIPIHAGNSHIIGEMAGVEEVTLTILQMPVHTHPIVGSAAIANRRNPKNALFAATKDPLYAPPAAPVQFASDAVAPVGGSQPHSNMQPYTCVNFIISLFGLYPPPP
jgi:microcystin-dependent protein